MKKLGCLLLACIMVLLSGVGELSTLAEGGSTKAIDKYDELRLKYYDLAVGGNYDPSAPTLVPMIESINDYAQELWDSMNKSPISKATNGSYGSKANALANGDDDYIWKEFYLGNYNNSSQTGSAIKLDSNALHFTYEQLRAVTLAHETPGAALYHNEDLKKDILDTVEFLHVNHNNENVTNYGNWFTWEIGMPISLSEIVILMYDYLSPENVFKYANITRRYAEGIMSGTANSLWQMRSSLYAGILLKDAQGMYKGGTKKTGGELLNIVKVEVPKHLNYVSSGDGFHKDGTYIAHNYFAYNGGYGYTAISESIYLVMMLEGSEWAIVDSRTDNIYQWIYDSFETIVQDGVLMDTFRGRELARKDMKEPDAAIIVANALLLARDTTTDAEHIAALESILKAWYSNSYAFDNLRDSARLPWHKFPMYTVVEIDEILNDDAIEIRRNANKNLQFVMGDRTVHYGEDYGFSIGMFSNRMQNYESMDVNWKGWHTGSGMTSIYNNDIGRYNGENKATIDWHRIPGATAVYGKTTTKNSSATNGRAGGLTLDSYGVSAMQLVTPGTNLRTKKSWYMFDNEVVALGTDINGVSSGTVETTIENYMSEGAFYVNGAETLSAAGQTTLNDVSYVNFAGNTGDSLGVYFPQPEVLEGKREVRTGKWSELGDHNKDATDKSAEYVTLWKDHGTAPTNGDYAYVLLPNQSTDETADYAGNSDVQIIQNDNDVQGVFESSLNILGATYWSTNNVMIGGFGYDAYLSVDRPASVMIKESDNELSFALTDINRQSQPIMVEINRQGTGVISKDSSVEVIRTTPTIQLKVNVSGAKGATISAKIALSPQPVPAKTEIESWEMVGDNLVVTLKKVEGATSYSLKYGLVSGVYTEDVTSSSNIVSVLGLAPSTAYFMVAYGENSSGNGEDSDEQEITLPSTTLFVEEFADTSKMYSYENIKFEAKETGVVGTDKEVAYRNTTALGSVIYKLKGLEDFALIAHKHATYNGSVNIYKSDDGITWTAVATNALNPGSSWVSTTLEPDAGEITAGTNYLKLELTGTDKAWSPSLGRLEATFALNPVNKELIDTFSDTKKAFSFEGVSLLGGKATGSSSGGEIVYSVTEIDKVSVTPAGTVTMEVSADGETYETLSDPSNVPSGMDFLKITLGSAAEISKVAIEYTNTIKPIKKLRIEEPEMLSAVGYSTMPTVKIAPMNASEDIVYSSDDDTIATFVSGTLAGKEVGSTTIRVAGFESKSVTATQVIQVWTNLALSKTVSSGNSHTSYTKDKAVDGKVSETDRWQSLATGAAWLSVDLGEKMPIDHIALMLSQADAKYTIQYSDNGTTWSDKVEVTDTAKRYYAVDTAGLEARYIRINGVTNKVYGIIELFVLSQGEEVAATLTNLALNKPTTAEAQISPGNLASMAVDGNEATYWNVGAGASRHDGLWWYVDLKEISKIHSVNILWEGAYGKEYKIQISDDALTWTDVVGETNGKVGWMKYDLTTPVNARYVKMQGVLRGTQWSYGLMEFQVMGESISGVTNITMVQPEITMLQNSSRTVFITTVPAVVADGKIKWESSNNLVATISQKGVVKSLSPGTTTITASYVDNGAIFDSCVLTVAPYSGEVVPVTEVRITGEPTDEVDANEEIQLAGEVLPVNATNKGLLWSSSDTAIAVVSSNGKVVTLAPGTVTITAKSITSVHIGSVLITVKEPVRLQTVTEAKTAAIAAIDNYIATNDTVEGDIMSLVEGVITNSNITASWSVAFEKVVADEKKAGRIGGEITLTDPTADSIRSSGTLSLGHSSQPSMSPYAGGVSATIVISKTIAKLDEIIEPEPEKKDLQKVKTDLEAILNSMVITNGVTKEMVMAIVRASITDATVTANWASAADSFALTPSYNNKDGKLVIKIELSAPNVASVGLVVTRLFVDPNGVDPEKPVPPIDPGKPVVPVTPVAPEQSGSSGNRAENGTNVSDKSPNVSPSTARSTMTAAPLSKSAADAAINRSKEAAKTSNSNTVVVGFKNVSVITYAQQREMIKAVEGKNLVINADSMDATLKNVDVRIYLDPTKLTKDINVSASIRSEEVKAVTTSLQGSYSGVLAVIKFEQDSFEIPVQVAARLKFSDVKAEALFFYHYNPKTKTLTRIENPAAWIDSSGYIRFTTKLGGYIIVSKGALTEIK